MVRARFKGAQKVASIAVILVAGILWNLFGKVGFRQNIFWGGALLLGFVLIFRFLENHEIGADCWRVWRYVAFGARCWRGCAALSQSVRRRP